VLPALAAAARPGHCSTCNRFLYRRADSDRIPCASTDEANWDIWVANTVGDLLAATPTVVPTCTHAHFVAGFEALIAASNASGHETYGSLARTARSYASLMYRLSKGDAPPSLPILLRLSHHFGVSLVDLLIGEARRPQWERRSSAVIAPAVRPHAPPVTPDAARLRQAVTALLSRDESPPPSMAEVARRLGCSDAALCRLFPADCQLISNRYQAFRREQRDKRLNELIADVRQAMTQLDARGIYPASKRIWPLMRQRVHPRRSDYNVARRQILHELGWSTGGIRLTGATRPAQDTHAD